MVQRLPADDVYMPDLWRKPLTVLVSLIAFGAMSSTAMAAEWQAVPSSPEATALEQATEDNTPLVVHHLEADGSISPIAHVVSSKTCAYGEEQFLTQDLSNNDVVVGRNCVASNELEIYISADGGQDFNSTPVVITIPAFFADEPQVAVYNHTLYLLTNSNSGRTELGLYAWDLETDSLLWQETTLNGAAWDATLADALLYDKNTGDLILQYLSNGNGTNYTLIRKTNGEYIPANFSTELDDLGEPRDIALAYTGDNEPVAVSAYGECGELSLGGSYFFGVSKFTDGSFAKVIPAGGIVGAVFCAGVTAGPGPTGTNTVDFTRGTWYNSTHGLNHDCLFDPGAYVDCGAGNEDNIPSPARVFEQVNLGSGLVSYEPISYVSIPTTPSTATTEELLHTTVYGGSENDLLDNTLAHTVNSVGGSTNKTIVTGFSWGSLKDKLPSGEIDSEIVGYTLPTITSPAEPIYEFHVVPNSPIEAGETSWVIRDSGCSGGILECPDNYPSNGETYVAVLMPGTKPTIQAAIVDDNNVSEIISTELSPAAGSPALKEEPANTGGNGTTKSSGSTAKEEQPAKENGTKPKESGTKPITHIEIEVSGGNISISLKCSTSCSIKITLSITESKKTVIIGEKEITLAGGKSTKASIELNAKGKKLLRQHHTLSVRVTANQGGMTLYSQAVKLRAEKKHKR
jgi:hypothetical protein